MNRRVLIRLRQSILGQAVRLYLAEQPGVDVIGAGEDAGGADPRGLQPDAILIEADGVLDVQGILRIFPGARVIAFTGDGALTVYRKDEMRAARLDDLLHVISTG